MKKFVVTEDEFFLFANSTFSMMLCLFGFVATAGAAAFWVILPAFGIETFSVNTDISLWPLWVTLLALFWLAVAAVCSHFLGLIADDVVSGEFNISKAVGRVNWLLLKGASSILYPALLFWKVVIFTTLKIFRKK